MKKMKKIRNAVKVLLLLLMVAMLSACGQKKKTEVADSDDWRDRQVIAHGVRLKDVGNMTVADLEKLGFKKGIFASEVEAGKTAIVSMSATDGSKGFYDFRVVNKSDKTADVDTCYIEGIYILQETKEDELPRATDISLANGVKIGMTSDEVKEIMGAPGEEKIKDDSESFYKSWKYFVDSDEVAIFMAFDKETDKLKTLMITF